MAWTDKLAQFLRLNDGEQAYTGYPQMQVGLNKPRQAGYATGFLEGATGMESMQPKNPITDPNYDQYAQGKNTGEAVGIGAMAIPGYAMALRAGAPKAAQMVENYMAKTGGLHYATNPNYYPEAMQEMTELMPIAGTVKNVAKTLQDKGLILDVYESAKNPLITLSRIEVPKQMRNSGMGTQALQELAQYADESAKTIALSPSKDFGATSVDRLKDFYKRFGFVENKGRNKDFSISESMYRAPIEPTRKELIEKQVKSLKE